MSSSTPSAVKRACKTVCAGHGRGVRSCFSGSTGAYCYGKEASGKTSFAITAQLLAENRIPVEGLITHRFPIRDYRAAIRTFLSKNKSKAIKVVLEHTE